MEIEWGRNNSVVKRSLSDRAVLTSIPARGEIVNDLIFAQTENAMAYFFLSRNRNYDQLQLSFDLSFLAKTN